MNQRIKDVLDGTYENYIMPFLWLHGVEENILRNCVAKIYECGIRAMCLEARPHKDFIGNGWWHDLDIILDEAKRRGMKIWILDDSHFPTGFANGAVKNAPDHLKRWSLVERTIEVCGPVKHCKYDVASRLGYNYVDKGMNKLGEPFKEKLVAVVAGRRTEQNGKVIYTELDDVTAEVTEDGWLCKDFPDGDYCLFIYTKRLDAAAGKNDYISMIEKDSVKILLDTVYEPHYAHYKEEFGKTILGFFSDEPGFYNMEDAVYGLGQIGQKMPLPWTDDVAGLFKERTSSKNMMLLVGLFHELGGEERLSRYTYMDIITRKYQENFTDQIGTWCEAHNVEYIGHVLEDGLFTQSLGAGTGHYFRALHGQHMSGVDVVLNDLLPDKDYGDRVFYHYQLPVLASSLAQQNSKMQGRAMCEVFGGFGWSQGLSMMKWMTDHMLVNGINYFVPHAFTDSQFPDSDCPPHFYAQGNNPQYRHMYMLYEYTNRISHLLSGGRPVTDVAVFFPAEGGWTGECRDFGYIGKICLQNQIPYAVLCMDMLKDAKVCDGKIVVGQAIYKCLIVDKMDYLPLDYLTEFEKLIKKGACIRFVEKVPEVMEMTGDAVLLEKEQDIVLKEDELLSFMETYRICRPAVFTKWLRAYRYEQDAVSVFLFVNSSMLSRIETEIAIEDLTEAGLMKTVVGYDALNQKLFDPMITKEKKVRLFLDKGESVILFMGEKSELPGIYQENCTLDRKESGDWERFDGTYQISAADYWEQDVFKTLAKVKELESVDKWKQNFAGILRYEMEVSGRKTIMNLGECNGSAEVWVNDQNCGVRISYPFTFDIGKYMTEEKNHIRIELATTLFEAVKDPLSMDRAVEMAGIYGPVMFR